MTGNSEKIGKVVLEKLHNDPVNWLSLELDRLRSLPSLLEWVATATVFKAQPTEHAVQELRTGVSQFLSCEVFAVLPVLQLVAHKDDDIEKACHTIATDQRILSADMRLILSRMEALRFAEEPFNSDPWLVERLGAVASRLRGHFALTSAIILPILRVRIKQPELTLLSSELVSVLGL